MKVKKKMLGTALFILVLYSMVLLISNRFWARRNILHEWILIHPPSTTQTVMTISMPDMGNEIWEIISKHNHSGLLQLRDAQGRKRAEYLVADGMRHGHGILWSMDGQKIMEAAYISNQLSGTYTTWHTGGRISHTGDYLHGEPIGEQLSWHKNGKMARKQFRTNGLLHGRSKIWDQSGELIEDALYNMGQPIKGYIVIEWDGESPPTVIDAVEHAKKTEIETIGVHYNDSIIYKVESDVCSAGAPD